MVLVSSPTYLSPLAMSVSTCDACPVFILVGGCVGQGSSDACSSRGLPVREVNAVEWQNMILVSSPTYLSPPLSTLVSTCDACPEVLVVVGDCVVSQMNRRFHSPFALTIVSSITSFFHWSVPDGSAVSLLSTCVVVVVHFL